MRVFGIGLSRTGTTSLHRAFELLNLRSVHFPTLTAGTLVAVLEPYQAATDLSVARYFREIDRTFAGAKFVLTVRDLDGWLRSVEQHFERNPLASYPLEGRRPREYIRELRRALYGAETFDASRFAEAWRRHGDEVRAHFRQRPGQLLILDICGGAGWEPLCRFLELPVPRLPFPHQNRRARRWQRWAARVRRAVPRARKP
jgi:hypothetical protein